MTLHRARGVQRSTDLEMPAGVVGRVNLVGVGEHATGLVDDKGVVLPAVPEFGDDVEEFTGPLVADLVARAGVSVEVAGLVGAGRGDDVPPRAAAAEVIQGGELSGQM